MKNKIYKILKFSLTLAIIGYIVSPHISSAASMLDGPAVIVINNTIAIIGNFLLSATSQLVTVSGTLLNLSLNITTHVGDFYNNIPALNEVWLVVRNMSSIFIIFALLYSSIKVIVGAGSSSATKELIVKIVIAGVLINFSLFFTKVLIDGSNLVSLQFYRAIAPKSAGSLSTLSSAFNDGGISDVLMSSLKIPQIYQNNKVLGAQDVFLSIGIATIGGMLMMITAAISLLGAAVAFMFRTAYLIFIMAVSPIYFAAMIFPQLEDKAKEVTKMFKSQLIFMPAYLFLMYVALKLISSPGFSAVFNQSANGVPGAGEGPFGLTFVGVVVQFVIASIFINAPLLVAIQLGASGAKFAEGWTETMNKKLGSVVGRNTAGRIGRSLGSGFDNMAAKAESSDNRIVRGASSVLRTVGISKAVRGVVENMEKSKYGSQSIGDVEKEDKERSRVVADVQRSRARREATSAVIGPKANPTPEQIDTFRNVIGRMNAKELEKVKFSELTEPMFISHISSSQAEKLLEGDSMTEQQKVKFKDIRKKELEKILTTTMTPSSVEKIVKILSGKELSKLKSDVFNNNNVLDYLAPSQLKDMTDMDRNVKAKVGAYITQLGQIPGNPHKSIGYMRKNIQEWS